MADPTGHSGLNGQPHLRPLTGCLVKGPRQIFEWGQQEGMAARCVAARRALGYSDETGAAQDGRGDVRQGHRGLACVLRTAGLCRGAVRPGPFLGVVGLAEWPGYGVADGDLAATAGSEVSAAVLLLLRRPRRAPERARRCWAQARPP